MAAKRRLPVVQNPPEDDGEEPRPAWHWVGFGAVGVFTTWLPLAWIAGRIASALGPSLLASLVPHVVGLALAAVAGGFLVGRWGSGPREAALAGATAGALAALLAVAGGTVSLGVVVVIALAALFGWLGGKLGVRRKARTR